MEWLQPKRIGGGQQGARQLGHVPGALVGRRMAEARRLQGDHPPPLSQARMRRRQPQAARAMEIDQGLARALLQHADAEAVRLHMAFGEAGLLGHHAHRKSSLCPEAVS